MAGYAIFRPQNSSPLLLPRVEVFGAVLALLAAVSLRCPGARHARTAPASGASGASGAQAADTSFVGGEALPRVRRPTEPTLRASSTSALRRLSPEFASQRQSLLPRQALQYAQSLAGSGSRELMQEFKRSYRENPYPEKLRLFFPDDEKILQLLYQSGVGNYTASSFIRTVDLVFRQLHGFGPPAWPSLKRLLSKEHPWTEAYCSIVIAEGVEARFRRGSGEPYRPFSCAGGYRGHGINGSKTSRP